MRNPFRPFVPLAALAALALAPLALAQDYGPGPTTFYLHRGSTFQQGCWGPCACPLTVRAAMHGSFTLRLISPGNATDFYGITDINWSVPLIGGSTFGNIITGSGSFAAGQAPFNPNQTMTLDLAATRPLIGPAVNAQVFNSKFGLRTVPPPIISIELANSDTGCPGTRLQLVATWFKSDWNADARISVQDLFDFLADYFDGRGDYTGEGVVTVEDVFAFLADWFAGV